MKTKQVTVAICFLLLLSSCHNKEKNNSLLADLTIDELKKEPQNEKNNTTQSPTIPLGALRQEVADSAASPDSPIPTKPAANPDWDKKIIKTATLKLEVKDFKSYTANVHNTVKQFGGYIAQEEQNISDQKSETVVSIKVPVDQFEPMMNQLPGGDVKIIEKKITTEDVTGEVVDIKSRLEAKKQMRLKYLEFLKQSKNMEEVLQVQNEINSIQEEIEAAAGRVAFLSHQSSYSTINLTFYQPLPGFQPVDETPSFFSRAGHAFKTGGNWIADLFIGLLTLWPLWLIVIGIYMIYKKIKIAHKPVIND